MQDLCRRADVVPTGVHALRHSAGTRLYAETYDLEATARHLGHTKLETTRSDAKGSDRQLGETIGRWSGATVRESAGPWRSSPVVSGGIG